MEPALQALLDQAKRVSALHPDLLTRYLAAIRDKARGMPSEELEALLKEVSEAVAAARPPGGHDPTRS